MPSKLAQAVLLLTDIREMFGSNLGRNTDYSNWNILWFRVSALKLGQGPPYSSQFIHSHSTVRRYG
jgi:hypothetical protein